MAVTLPDGPTPGHQSPLGESSSRRREGDAGSADFALRFVDTLQAGDPAAAEEVAQDAVLSGLSVQQIYSHVITPSMHRIGDLWESGDCSIGGEHLATAISQGVMARLFPRLLGKAERTRDRVLLAAAQGEHHVLGLRMMADTLEGEGYDVRYLGADVPLASLVDACAVHRPVVLGLGASMALNIPTLLWEVAEVAMLDDAPAVMIGGAAADEALREGLDVPLGRDCEDIAAIVARLIEAPERQQAITPSLARRGRLEAPAPDAVGDPTLAGAFSATSMAAADAARDAARSAFNLEELAYRDSLTGLWNRRAYDDRLAQLETEAGSGAALMLDIDNFKAINDTYGHDAGDEALVGVGKAISTSLRPSDFGARFGGDEFVILLPGMDTGEAAAVAERIRVTTQRDLSDPPVTVSIGVASFSGEARRTNHLIDQALYDAKHAGRNQVASVDA